MAFKSRYAHFKYQVMSFNLFFSPASFERQINKTLTNKLHVFAILYLDDILTNP